MRSFIRAKSRSIKTMAKIKFMKQLFKTIFPIGLFITLFTSCDDNKFDVELKGEPIELSFKRLDQDMFGSDSAHFAEVNKELQKKYTTFYKRYALNVLNLGYPEDPAFVDRYKFFLNQPGVMEVYEATQKAYPDLETYQKQLSKAFDYYHYHFPDLQVPELVAMITGFQYKVSTDDSVLAVGIDMYIPNNGKMYVQAGLPQYKIDQAIPERMVHDAMRGWLISEFEPKKPSAELLDYMIHYGKILYTMEACFPFDEKASLIGYTTAQMQWCSANEGMAWGSLIENTVLFEKKKEIVMRYISDGPFTPGMPKESPGQMPYWLGWQIVREYMNDHPNTTLKQLFEIEDARMILNESGYKPKM